MNSPSPLKDLQKALTRRANLQGFLRMLAFAAFSGSMVKAQTSLTVGDIQVIGVTADANDSFTFVLWKDIAANTVIRFMDQSFTNATVGVLGTENDMSLSFTTGLAAGTVIRVEDTGTTLTNGGTFSGTKTGSLSGISASGDQVFSYQGAAMSSVTDFTGRTLLHGFNIADTSWLTTGTANSNNSYLPTAINSADANLDSGNFDNADYTGARTGLTTTAYRAAISSLTNYTQSDTRSDLATGGFTIAGSTQLHWDANGSTANNGGSGTWDTTTVDRFKNGAAGTTYLRWVNSSAGSDHTAVFGGTAGTVSVASGGVTASGLQFDTNAYTLQSNTVTLTGAAPAINVTTGTSTISSTLTGTAGFTKTGTGTLSLTGANTLSGDTVITANAGSLSLGNVNALQNSTLDTGASGTQSVTLDVPGTNTYNLGALKGTDAIEVGGNTISVGANNQSTTYSGSISGSGGALTKVGTGTLTLSQSSSYSGGTTVSAGKLNIINTSGSATGSGNLQVTGTSVILGTGTVAPASGGSVTIGGGATVSVGNATGDTTGKILTFTPFGGTITTTFQTSSILEFDLFSGAGLGNQTGNNAAADIFRYGGSLSIGSGVKLKVTSALTGFASNDSWRLFDWSTLGGSAFTGSFDSSLVELPSLSGPLAWDLSQLSTSGSISVVAIPEPSRALLMVVGLCSLLSRRRR